MLYVICFLFVFCSCAATEKLTSGTFAARRVPYWFLHADGTDEQQAEAFLRASQLTLIAARSSVETITKSSIGSSVAQQFYEALQFTEQLVGKKDPTVHEFNPPPGWHLVSTCASADHPEEGGLWDDYIMDKAGRRIRVILSHLPSK